MSIVFVKMDLPDYFHEMSAEEQEAAINVAARLKQYEVCKPEPVGFVPSNFKHSLETKGVVALEETDGIPGEIEQPNVPLFDHPAVETIRIGKNMSIDVKQETAPSGCFLVGPCDDEFLPYIGKKVLNLRTTPYSDQSLAAAIRGPGGNRYFFELEGISDGTFSTYYEWAFWIDTPESRKDFKRLNALKDQITVIEQLQKELRAKNRLFQRAPGSEETGSVVAEG